MKRSRSSSREFWIAIGVSMAFHFLAGFVFWAISGNSTTEIPETEVEWTWTAPAAEKMAPSRSVPATVAGRQPVAPAVQAPITAPGPSSGTETAVKNPPTPGLAPTAGSVTGPVPSGSGTPTGGTLSAPNTPSVPIPSVPAASSSFYPDSGDSTGYALVPPKIRERPALILPPEARQSGLSGNVLLLVEVLEEGRVGKIVVNRSSGSKILDEAARENVSRWRFDPAWQPQGNKPVRVITSVWIRYTREGS